MVDLWSFDEWVPPVSIPIGPLDLYFYSLCLVIAVWVSYFLATRQADHWGLSREKVSDGLVVALIAGIVGARIAFVLQNTDVFAENWLDVFRLTTGGLSIHGGLVGGGLALAYYARRLKLNFYRLTDSLVLPLLVGQTIGRLGNFFNQELFGYPTSLPWKILIEPGYRPAGYFTDRYFHPTFLYEILFNLVGIWLLSRGLLSKNKAVGRQSWLYILCYSVSRFLTEIWRISDRYVADLSLGQLVSLVLIVVAVFQLLRLQIEPGTANRKTAARHERI